MSVGPIHELSGEQYEVLMQIVNYGYEHGHDDFEVIAAVEIGIVEDSLHNRAEPGNSAVGWSQEEPEYGSVAHRLEMASSLQRVYGQLREHRHEYATTGELAQGIQRSAYPLRYGEKEGLAKQLISELGANAHRPGSGFGPSPTQTGALVTGQMTATPAVKGDELDYSSKVVHTGKRASQHGATIGGHAKAIRAVASRNARL